MCFAWSFRQFFTITKTKENTLVSCSTHGAWATSKKLPCLHKAYYRPQAYWPCQYRPQAYWPCQYRPQANWPCQYAPAQYHDRWPVRDQGCYGRTSRDTLANRSSRSRHDDAELLSRGNRSNRVVHGPVERMLSPSTGPKRFRSFRCRCHPSMLRQGLAARRDHWMSKLKYIHSSAKLFYVDKIMAREARSRIFLTRKKKH